MCLRLLSAKPIASAVAVASAAVAIAAIAAIAATHLHRVEPWHVQ